MPQVSVGGNGLGLGSQVWAVAHERCLSLGKRRRSLTSQKQNGMATFLLKRVREVGEMVMGRNVVVMSLHRGACFKLLSAIADKAVCAAAREETVDTSG